MHSTVQDGLTHADIIV